MSYLNTVPLVYGMLHGQERSRTDVSFALPSLCAEQVREGSVDIGLAPVAEIARQNLEVIPGLGIAARGAVRSILLFGKKPWRSVRTVAADTSSRTSVELTRVILREQYGVEPALLPHAPDLDGMLATADAALIIGDPALHIEPEKQRYEWLDLAASWYELTRLSFVFAAWAGKPGVATEELAALTWRSYEFGRERMGEIAKSEASARHIEEALALRYLTDNLRYEIGAPERQGWQAFLNLAGLTRSLEVTA